jgi:hypothetical protein
MGSWWHMMCDGGHRWELFQEGDGEPPSESLVCREDGLPAVTAMSLPLADRAVIEISPMAWEREGVVGRRNEYRLEIRSTVRPGEHLRSAGDLSWDDVVRYAKMLHDVSWEQAQRRWARIPRLASAAR